MKEEEVRVGDLLPMPHTPYHVRVLQLSLCAEGRLIFRFCDPVFGMDDWAHVHEFTDPPLTPPAETW